MSKTKELVLQLHKEFVNGWDAVDADYFYQKYLENNK